jgi:hypothetical protein
MSGSTTDWIAASMNGSSEYQPYFAASKAFSTYSSRVERGSPKGCG